MNQIFIRFFGTVLAILDFVIPSAHGADCTRDYVSYCMNEDDVLISVPYANLPENAPKQTRAAPTGTDTSSGCSGMSCTSGCKYDKYDHVTSFGVDATDNSDFVKYKYMANGRIGFCTETGIWMPYGLVKEFMPSASDYLTGSYSGYRNTQWPSQNERNLIGTWPCVTTDGETVESLEEVDLGCSSGCYANATGVLYNCLSCPASSSYDPNGNGKYTAQPASTCAGKGCCSLSVTTTDTRGTFTIKDCPYEE